MKKILVLLSSLFLCCSCSHKTIHQYCQEHLMDYKDYDQCYAERSEAAKVAANKPNPLQAFSNGFNANRNTTNCTTTGSAGYYNTTCH